MNSGMETPLRRQALQASRIQINKEKKEGWSRLRGWKEKLSSLVK